MSLLLFRSQKDFFGEGHGGKQLSFGELLVSEAFKLSVIMSLTITGLSAGCFHSRNAIW